MTHPEKKRFNQPLPEMDLMTCPKCDRRMRIAFCNRASGLFCTDPAEFAHVVIRDADLSASAWCRLIPWTARWHPAHLCEECGIYVVEYRRTFSRKQVEAVIDRLHDKIITEESSTTGSLPDGKRQAKHAHT